MHYIVFDSLGIIKNIYSSELIAKFYAGEYSNYFYCPIIEQVYEYYLQNNNNFNTLCINIQQLKEDKKDIIDNPTYFFIKEEIEFERIKSNIIWNIGKSCENYIFAGKKITLKDGTEEIFTFSPLEQLELFQLVNFHSKGQKVYYHSYNNLYKFYDYDDIVLVYKELYNNKVYNLIYSQVFTSWINENLTYEMLQKKEIYIDYGYSNDEILQQVEEIFYNERLS